MLQTSPHVGLGVMLVTAETPGLLSTTTTPSNSFSSSATISSLSFAYFASIFGISIISVVGVSKMVGHWKQIKQLLGGQKRSPSPVPSLKPSSQATTPTLSTEPKQRTSLSQSNHESKEAVKGVEEIKEEDVKSEESPGLEHVVDALQETNMDIAADNATTNNDTNTTNDTVDDIDNVSEDDILDEDGAVLSVIRETTPTTLGTPPLPPDLASTPLPHPDLSDVTPLPDALEEARKRIELLEEELREALEHTRALTLQTAHLTSEAETLREERDVAVVTQAETAALLDRRTAELRGAQTYLTKADTLSGADVIALMEALNAEILQIAADAAQSFVFLEKVVDENGDIVVEENEQGGASVAEIEEAWASATEILGTRMVDLLRMSSHHDDPMLVQIAFQAGMTAYSEWMISSWYFENPQNEQALSDIYERVRDAEDQAVSGRWRALTRMHAQKISKEEPDLSLYFIDAFVNVLLIAGYQATQSALHDIVASKFTDRIAVIVRNALRLKKAIGEGMTSCDMEAIYIAPDDIFNPTTMEEGFAASGEDGRSGKEKEKEPVLCTTDLGLFRAEKIAGGLNKWKETLLLKPKIVLQSSLEEGMR